jgi:hypothetical protein
MSYGVDIAEYPLCSRCMVNPNATSYLRAHLPNAGKVLNCAHTTDPAGVRRWAEAVLNEDGEAVFELDSWTRALRPVTTWQGDPVCVVHLVERRLAELGQR